MAGTNQHHIPQFLQKGFAETHKKQPQIRAYRIGTEPFVTSTRNVGATRNFYGKPGEGSLDDAITQLEGNLGQFLNNVRGAKAIKEEDRARPAQLIKHLWSRSANIRSSMQILTERLCSAFKEAAATPASFWEMLGQSDEERHTRIEELAVKEAQSQFPHLSEPLIKARLKAANVDYLALLEESQDQFPWMQSVLGELEQRMGQVVAEAHNSALLKVGGEAKMEAVLNDFRWDIIPSSGDSLILGDACALALGGSDKNDLCPIAVFGGEAVTGVFMPISNDLLLAGRAEGQDFMPDAEVLNNAAARWSIEFFISHPEDDFSRYHGLISRGWDQFINELLQEELPSPH